MILVRINLNGLIESIEANTNVQYSSGVNEMVILSPYAPTTPCTLTFERPDGFITPSHVPTPSQYSDPIIDDTIPCYRYTLQSEELFIDGNLKFTISFFTTTTQSSSTIGMFYVYKSLAYNTKADIDFTTEIMQIVAGLQESLLPISFVTQEVLDIVDSDDEALFVRTVTPVLQPGTLEGVVKYDYVDSIKLALPRGRDGVITWGVNQESTVSTIDWAKK